MGDFSAHLETLEEGRFVKSVDDKVVNKLFKDFILKQKQEEENIPKGDIDRLTREVNSKKLREYVEKYIEAYKSKGAFSSAEGAYKDKKGMEKATWTSFEHQ